MKVPFLDLDAQYQPIKKEILTAIEKVLDDKQFIQGPYCEEFSKNFLKVHGGNYATGCSNGTSAITIALRSLGITSGDEVITAANTFFATIEAICEVDATPVLVDCCPKTYCIDVNQIEEKITNKTKAIIPVHLYGNSCQMDKIIKLKEKYNLKVIEDCAQSHLARFNNQATGTWGDAGTFSFYPGKNLGAYGDAGLIITKDEATLNLANKYINHGRTKKYEHDLLAGNYRMDGIQATVLNVKLKYLNEWTKKRQDIATKYDMALKEKGFKVIEKSEGSECVYHLYIVEVSNRDEVINGLKKAGVETGIHYPIPMHLQPALEFLNQSKGSFKNVEFAAERILSLPIFPELTPQAQEYVLTEFFKIAKK